MSLTLGSLSLARSPSLPPGSPYRSGQEADLKRALEDTDPSIPLVFVSGNHDLGNTPTPATVQQYCQDWGDDYFSFWVSATNGGGGQAVSQDYF